MKRMQMAVLSAALVVAAAACGGSDSPTGGNNNNGGGTIVTASAASVFSPSSVTIAVGGTVTWEFGPLDHNVIFTGTAGAPASISATHSTSVSRTFNTAGSFAYVCTLHSNMAGVVFVGSGSSNTNTGY